MGGRPNHCLSSQILPKIFPKSFQNPFEILSKSTKIGPKSCPKSILDPKRGPKPSRTRFFQFFIDFLSPRGPPKSSQNHQKSKKIDEKSMSKKHMVFNTICSRFFMVLASEIDSKIEVFWHCFRRFSEHVDFVRISVSRRR